MSAFMNPPSETAPGRRRQGGVAQNMTLRKSSRRDGLTLRRRAQSSMSLVLKPDQAAGVKAPR
jgi:hypothetical protein